MLLTKYTHATVTLQKNGHTLLIDPGTLTPNAADLLAAADAVLITHEHFDHFDTDTIVGAMKDRGDLHLYGPASIAPALADVAAQVHAVATGESFDIAGFTVETFVVDHAVIHPEIPLVDNVGFLIDGTVFHPGDAYLNPERTVETLLLPISGPWISTEQAIDYVRALAPRRSIAIHDVMLSDTGKATAGMFLGAGSLTGTALDVMELGASQEI